MPSNNEFDKNIVMLLRLNQCGAVLLPHLPPLHYCGHETNDERDYNEYPPVVPTSKSHAPIVWRITSWLLLTQRRRRRRIVSIATIETCSFWWWWWKWWWWGWQKPPWWGSHLPVPGTHSWPMCGRGNGTPERYEYRYDRYSFTSVLSPYGIPNSQLPTTKQINEHVVCIYTWYIQKL